MSAVVALVLAIAVGVGGFVWWSVGTSGPGYDAGQATASLRRALFMRHPELRHAGAQLRCDGLRDGADFFGCLLTLKDGSEAGYSVSYGDGRYTAMGTYEPRGSVESFSFDPT